MKKWMAILSIVFLGFSANAQNDTLNQVDDEGRKQGYWIIYGKDKPEKGYCDTCKIEEGPYLEGRKHGTWLKYYPDGEHIRCKGEYWQNRPQGKYVKYYENGNVKEVGEYDWHHQIGEFRQYYPNGQLSCQKTFDESGKQIGIALFYDENGCLELKREVNNSYRFQGDYKVIYSEDQCNVPLDTLYLDEMVPPPCFVPEGGFNYQFSKPEGDCDYFYELENASNGQQKLYDDEERLIVDGVVKDGWLVKGEMYCYQSDGRIKVFKYKEGKVIKHWWEYPDEE